MDESNVGVEVVWVPVGVGLPLEGGDLDPVRLRTCADIVSSGWLRLRLAFTWSSHLHGPVLYWVNLTHDIKVSSTIGAVGCSHHPLVGDEGASAEPGVVHEKSDLMPPHYILWRAQTFINLTLSLLI